MRFEIPGRFLDLIKKLVRWALVLAIIIYVLTAIIGLARGDIGSLFYLPMYGFLFGQVPAAIIIPLLGIYRRIHRKPVWKFIRKESWLLIASIAAYFLFMLCMWYVYEF